MDRVAFSGAASAYVTLLHRVRQVATLSPVRGDGTPLMLIARDSARYPR